MGNNDKKTVTEKELNDKITVTEKELNDKIKEAVALALGGQQPTSKRDLDQYILSGLPAHLTRDAVRQAVRDNLVFDSKSFCEFIRLSWDDVPGEQVYIAEILDADGLNSRSVMGTKDEINFFYNLLFDCSTNDKARESGRLHTITRIKDEKKVSNLSKFVDEHAPLFPKDKRNQIKEESLKAKRTDIVDIFDPKLFIRGAGERDLVIERKYMYTEGLGADNRYTHLFFAEGFIF